MSKGTICLFVVLAVVALAYADTEPKDEHAANCYQNKDTKDIYCTGCTGNKCNTCICPKGMCDANVVCNTCENKMCRTCKITGKTQDCQKCDKDTPKFWVVSDGKIEDKEKPTSCPPQ